MRKYFPVKCITICYGNAPFAPLFHYDNFFRFVLRQNKFQIRLTFTLGCCHHFINYCDVSNVAVVRSHPFRLLISFWFLHFNAVSIMNMHSLLNNSGAEMHAGRQYWYVTLLALAINGVCHYYLHSCFLFALVLKHWCSLSSLNENVSVWLNKLFVSETCVWIWKSNTHAAARHSAACTCGTLILIIKLIYKRV